ncbi:transposase [Lactobacillus amylovorus]|uniref:transposase n=1 Tax=Lactobacillus amylovorus TaxID=1604 RepID=UPI00232CA404|nr:transposase [Lactobacillus amylovorus]MDB6226786.1 transposase [Lactobacillus amylovorus]
MILHYRHHYKKNFSKNTQDASWDFEKLCTVKFRACKVRIIDPDTGKDEWQVLLTNLNHQEFPLPRMKKLYHLRWGIESSFRKLKYDLGCIQFHSKQDNFIEMEIYAHMIMFNTVSQINAQAYVPQ